MIDEDDDDGEDDGDDDDDESDGDGGDDAAESCKALFWIHRCCRRAMGGSKIFEQKSVDFVAKYER